MNFSPLLERTVKLGDKVGVVCGIHYIEFVAYTPPAEEGYTPHTRISPAIGGFTLLVLVDGHLENWSATDVKVE